MTPYEVSCIVAGYNDRQKQEQKLLMMNAWYCAYFNRVEKLPELKDLLKELDGEIKDDDDITQEFIELMKKKKIGGENK